MLVRHGLEPDRVDEPRVAPEEPTGDERRHWSLISCVVLALLPTVTRPIEGGEAARSDLWTTVERAVDRAVSPGPRGQRRSMMVTLAWPPPSHMVCSP